MSQLYQAMATKAQQNQNLEKVTDYVEEHVLDADRMAKVCMYVCVCVCAVCEDEGGDWRCMCMIDVCVCGGANPPTKHLLPVHHHKGRLSSVEVLYVCIPLFCLLLPQPIH